MEQIPMEVIEMAVDFFSHSSDEEKIDLRNKFYKDQPNLTKTLTRMLTTTKNPKMNEVCKFWYLIIYRSYHYYSIKMPLLTDNFVSDTVRIFLDDCVKINTSDEFKLPFEALLKNHVKQDNLLDYIRSDQIVKIPNEIVDTKSVNMSQGIFCIELMILVLNEAMKKKMEKEVN